MGAKVTELITVMAIVMLVGMVRTVVLLVVLIENREWWRPW